MKRFLLLSFGTLALAGCGTIIGGLNQDLTINTNPAGASCDVIRLSPTNEKLGTVASTPGTLHVRKSKYDLKIVCNHDGYVETTYLAHSGIESATWGDIALSGGIGWAVDSSTGSDNHYDTPVNITMLAKQN
jgi:hypothetical protein